MLIDVENQSTYPSALQKMVYKYIAVNLSLIETQIKKTTVESDNDVRCEIEKYLSPVKGESLYAQLLKSVAKHLSHDLPIFHTIDRRKVQQSS